VLITHEPDVGARANRLIRLRDGSIESDSGTADEPPTSSSRSERVAPEAPVAEVVR
jgi:ABC-type lipoprotein export system ATPase subunit